MLRSNGITVPEEPRDALFAVLSAWSRQPLEDKSSAVFLPAGAVPTPVDEAQSAELEEQLQDRATQLSHSWAPWPWGSVHMWAEKG